MLDKNELLKLLPKLIREDDEVKGAVITALSGVVATKDDIKLVIEEFNKRFEGMDKRFEGMDKRFERMDKRFEELIKLMNKGFEDARKDRELLRISITTLSTRGGVELHNTILSLLKDKLIQENIGVSEIKREDLIDSEGKIFYKNYNTDIDILIKNDKIILIEVKFKADNRDIYQILKKGELFKQIKKKNYDELMLVCLEINSMNFEQAIKQGVKVIAGKIT